METVVEARESMEMAPGAFPHPGRVPEQRFLSPEIGLRRRRRCETFLGKTLIFLGFRSPEALYRRRGGVKGRPGGPHHPLAWPGGGRATPWCGCSLGPSGSPSVLVLCPEKIGGSGFVLSNSENIFYVAFLKHKNSRKQGTGTVAPRQ
jgi:hypothetical protein